MIQKIKSYMLIFASALMFAVPALVPTISASARCSSIANNVQEGASKAGGDVTTCASGTGANVSALTKAANSLVKIFSLVVGAVAVIMIIYGGFRYITSGGDSGRVGAAKNSLIYAIVGLIIVALAQVIVHFVLNQTSEFST